MWENAAPAPPPQPAVARRTRRTTGSEEPLVLWVQILLCTAVVAVAFAAHTLHWPLLSTFREVFARAMQPEQTFFLSEQRNLAKFTEQATDAVARAAGRLWSGMETGATPETARRASHGKGESVPANARAESYLPSFSLTFPLAGHACTRTSGYGWRTDPMGGQGTDFRLGNDLAAAQGTEILAAADGVVRYAGVHSSYGNYLRILHADGDETLYAHMQYLFVRTGQAVTAGQVLGTVGETGNATGPHLHFEILHKGLRYDPSEALQSAA